LREHLGLGRPASRYAKTTTPAAANSPLPVA
jgi:hypothetical protein